MYMYYKQLSGKKWNVCYTKTTEKKQQRNEFSLRSTPKCQTHGKICPNSSNKGKFKTKYISIILEEVFCGFYRYTLNFDLLDARYVSDCPHTLIKRNETINLPPWHKWSIVLFLSVSSSIEKCLWYMFSTYMNFSLLVSE